MRSATTCLICGAWPAAGRGYWEPSCWPAFARVLQAVLIHISVFFLFSLAVSHRRVSLKGPYFRGRNPPHHHHQSPRSLKDHFLKFFLACLSNMYVNTGTFVWTSKMDTWNYSVKYWLFYLLLILTTYVFAELKSILKKNRHLYGNTLRNTSSFCLTY